MKLLGTRTNNTARNFFCCCKFELCANHLSQVLLVSVVVSDKFNLNFAGNFPQKRNFITQKTKFHTKNQLHSRNKRECVVGFATVAKTLPYCRKQPRLRKGFPQFVFRLGTPPHAANNKSISKLVFRQAQETLYFAKNYHKRRPKAIPLPQRR